MHRRFFVLGLVGIGVAGVIGGADDAAAAMPVTMPAAPEPDATTAEVQPGRDDIPASQNVQIFGRQPVAVRPRPVVVRRPVVIRRPVVVRPRPVVVRPRPRPVVIRRPVVVRRSIFTPRTVRRPVVVRRSIFRR